MLRCMILDDEPLALDLLEDYIRNTPFLQLQHRCTHPMDALPLLQSGAVDLVFSDIQMQGLNGMQLIRSLTSKPMFILVTAYHNFAVESYEFDVVDYLVKPVAYDRFVKAAGKALARHEAGKTNIVSEPGYVFLQVDYSMVKVILADILYIEGVKDYVRLHYTLEKKSLPLLVRISMKTIEDMLPHSSFSRIHKSYIVNITHINIIRKNSIFVAGIELPVGEQYKDITSNFINK